MGLPCSSKECFKTGSRRCTTRQEVKVRPALPHQLEIIFDQSGLTSPSRHEEGRHWFSHPLWTHRRYLHLVSHPYRTRRTISHSSAKPVSRLWISSYLNKVIRGLTKQTIGPIRENDMTSRRVFDSIPKQMLDQEIYLFINPQCPWSNDETYLWPEFTHHIHWSDLTSDVGRHRVQPI